MRIGLLGPAPDAALVRTLGARHDVAESAAPEHLDFTAAVRGRRIFWSKLHLTAVHTLMLTYLSHAKTPQLQ